MNPHVSIYEVGLRDGLQNLAKTLSLMEKFQIYESLVAAGLTRIELTSFVSPNAVPQLADADDLVRKCISPSALDLPVLVMNEKGFRRAVAAGARSIAFVLAVTETFSQKNNRMSVEDTCQSIESLMPEVVSNRLKARLYFSVAWVCPFEGLVSQDAVLKLLERFHDRGFSEIALSDTIGHADPHSVGRLIERACSVVPREKIAVHLHDTLAFGLANCVAALQAGIRTIDSAVGGLGGCPFAPGAAGNLATEDIVLMAEKMGFSTGVNLEAIWRTVTLVETILGYPVGGRTKTYHESCRSKQKAPRENTCS